MRHIFYIAITVLLICGSFIADASNKVASGDAAAEDPVAFMTDVFGAAGNEARASNVAAHLWNTNRPIFSLWDPHDDTDGKDRLYGAVIELTEVITAIRLTNGSAPKSIEDFYRPVRNRSVRDTQRAFSGKHLHLKFVNPLELTEVTKKYLDPIRNKTARELMEFHLKTGAVKFLEWDDGLPSRQVHYTLENATSAGGSDLSATLSDDKSFVHVPANIILTLQVRKGLGFPPHLSFANDIVMGKEGRFRNAFLTAKRKLPVTATVNISPSELNRSPVLLSPRSGRDARSGQF